MFVLFSWVILGKSRFTFLNYSLLYHLSGLTPPIAYLYPLQITSPYGFNGLSMSFVFTIHACYRPLGKWPSFTSDIKVDNTTLRFLIEKFTLLHFLCCWILWINMIVKSVFILLPVVTEFICVLKWTTCLIKSTVVF